LNEEWAGQIFRTEKPKKRKRIRKQPFGFKTCPCTSWLIDQYSVFCFLLFFSLVHRWTEKYESLKITINLPILDIYDKIVVQAKQLRHLMQA
jgi:hypothetical protein